MALEKELETYHKYLPNWSEHEGKFVLIKDDEVFGFFSSYDDVVREGYRRFKLDPFLAKRVNMIEQSHFISRLMV